MDPTIKIISLRDPAGQVVSAGKRIFRHVRPEGLRNLEAYQGSDVLSEFRDRENLISFSEVDEGDIGALLTNSEHEFSGTWIEHPKIPFVSYPHEWPAAALYDAGKLTLEIA